MFYQSVFNFISIYQTQLKLIVYLFISSQYLKVGTISHLLFPPSICLSTCFWWCYCFHHHQQLAITKYLRCSRNYHKHFISCTSFNNSIIIPRKLANVLNNIHTADTCIKVRSQTKISTCPESRFLTTIVNYITQLVLSHICCVCEWLTGLLNPSKVNQT